MRAARTASTVVILERLDGGHYLRKRQTIVDSVHERLIEAGKRVAIIRIVLGRHCVEDGSGPVEPVVIARCKPCIAKGFRGGSWVKRIKIWKLTSERNTSEEILEIAIASTTAIVRRTAEHLTDNIFTIRPVAGG